MITMCNFVIIICNFAPRPIADFYSFAGLLRVALGRAALWRAVSCAVAAAEIRFCAGAVCARLPLRPVRTGVRTGGCFLGKPGSGGEARSFDGMKDILQIAALGPAPKTPKGNEFAILR